MCFLFLNFRGTERLEILEEVYVYYTVIYIYGSITSTFYYDIIFCYFHHYISFYIGRAIKNILIKNMLWILCNN